MIVQNKCFHGIREQNSLKITDSNINGGQKSQSANWRLYCTEVSGLVSLFS